MISSKVDQEDFEPGQALSLLVEGLACLFSHLMQMLGFIRD